MNKYEITYEEILQRMLDRVPEPFAKYEGSVIFDALAPTAIEIQMMYIELNSFYQEAYADTATREYLIRRVRERGIIPYPATKAIMRAVANVDLEIGERLTCNDIIYSVVEKLDNLNFKVECEQVGTDSNNNFGEARPIDFVSGLEFLDITEVLIPGTDEEDTESIRQRYFESFKDNGYGGNVRDYLNKTNSISGVGATKVTPVWNGGGTVKLTILDTEFNKPSDTLIEKVQKIMDPTQLANGQGIAPIGHIVTVDGVEEVNVDVKINIFLDYNYTINMVLDKIKKDIEDYMLSNRKSWSTQDNLIVRVSRIENIILNTEGILDIGATTLNGIEENLTLNKYQIPILNNLNLIERS